MPVHFYFLIGLFFFENGKSGGKIRLLSLEIIAPGHFGSCSKTGSFRTTPKPSQEKLFFQAVPVSAATFCEFSLSLQI